MTEEISFKFPFANRFWMAIDSKSNGSIKLHLDAGTHKCKLTNKDVNLWGSIDTIKDHSMFNFNLGANIFTKDLDISSRISSKPNENCNLCFTTKVLKRFGNFFLGGMVCEKLCPSFKICNFDSVFGYEKDNMKFYLRHLTPECST